MNTAVKMIGVKYPSLGRQFTCHPYSDILVINDVNQIKAGIMDILFTKDYSYVLVNFDGKLYVCEKLDGTQYTKREVPYHPLASLIQ